MDSREVEYRIEMYNGGYNGSMYIPNDIQSDNAIKEYIILELLDDVIDVEFEECEEE